MQVLAVFFSHGMQAENKHPFSDVLSTLGYGCVKYVIALDKCPTPTLQTRTVSRSRLEGWQARVKEGDFFASFLIA